MTALIAIPIESRRHRDLKKSPPLPFSFYLSGKRKNPMHNMDCPPYPVGFASSGVSKTRKGLFSNSKPRYPALFSFLFFFFFVVSLGSRSRGRDFTVYVKDINQPSWLTPFYSVLVSILSLRPFRLYFIP